MNIFLKAARKIHTWSKNNYRLLRDFGIRVAWDDFLCNLVLCRYEKRYIYEGRFYEDIKNRIYEIYQMEINQIINTAVELDLCSDELPAKTIWIFWWQGEENIPQLVRSCRDSVLRNRGEMQVNVVSKYNYTEYVDVPYIFIDLLKKNKITITHFSDILRCYLLKQRGGLWLDATVWVTKPIQNTIVEKSLFTIKHGMFSDYHVCKGKWSTFCMYAKKNQKLMNYLTDMFYLFFSKYDYFPCYLLFDCFISIAYENNEYIKNDIEAIVINNEKTFSLRSKMSEVYSEDLIDKNTQFFKLSNRDILEESVSGKKTLYSYLLEYNER